MAPDTKIDPKPDPRIDYSFLTERQYEEIFVHHCFPNSKAVSVAPFTFARRASYSGS